ncbi:bifunctional serine/threonine-protein kinase/formylglycine-generating enzyme family protein [uncultured Bacteroides sp.]|uniref:bifunctional serine/threonine-protein kinase/formylglycine-generating enzyme family protein n=1 Tax=uncultured Bacteroides sp. TaxID=162156 RepID=UPI00322074F2
MLRHETYRIDRVLGQGGFGITYLATDLNLDRKVAIKEFFPKDYCGRETVTSHVTLSTQNANEFVNKLKSKFLKEARNIAKFDHPGIIKIHAAFEENNTAYYVMDYIEGESLSEMVKRNGPLPEGKAVNYIGKVGEALEYVHARKINHLDIKPANIMVRRSDDNPILIDFGLSKQYDSSGNQTSTTPTGISHGYAPMEQYNDGGVREFSPQTDVYSLGATLYFLLSGVTPPQATKLIEDELTFPSAIPRHLINPILKAMEPVRKSRYASASAFCHAITGDVDDDASTVDVPKPQPKPIPPKPQRQIPWKYIGSGVVAAIVVVLVSILISSPDPDDTEAPIADSSSLHLTYDNATNSIIYGNHSYKMMYIDGGSFDMGATPEQVSESYDYEKPVHKVTLSSYRIGATEVPQWLWVAIMGNNPSHFKGDNLPVERVSWNDCRDFISILNSLTGKNFNLPTEAQWEYAARGGSQSRGYKYSGGDNLDAVAMYDGNSGGKTHPVATKHPNELGLYDMSGNVWEWCRDWYVDYDKSSQTDPIGQSSDGNRVCRGGSYSISARSCRIASRGLTSPGDHCDYLGFRLAL